jgi:predicted RNA methylase
MIDNYYLADSIREYESRIPKAKRKANGIYYTDLDLAEKMFRDILSYNSKIMSLIDPCCGAGSFLYIGEKYGIKTVTGFDLDFEVIRACRQNTKFAKVKCADTIGLSGSETIKLSKQNSRFDLVVGNPPYVPIGSNGLNCLDYDFIKKVELSGSNLFVAALYRAFELAGNHGIISYIIPKNFLHVAKYSSLRKMILNEKTILSIIDIGRYFKEVRGEQIILTVKNCKSLNNKIKIKKYTGSEFAYCTQIPQSYYADEITIFKTHKDYTIYNKLSSAYNTLNDLCQGYIGRGKSKSIEAIKGKDIRKFGYKNIPIPEKGNQLFIQNIYSSESGIIASFAGNLEASETVTIFTDGDEKTCRYILGLLHSRLCNFYLYKFVYNSSSLTMHTDAKYLRKIPMKIMKVEKVVNVVRAIEKDQYLSPKWYSNMEKLNNLIYEIYEIDKEESAYIDNEMKLINSTRWFNNGISEAS